MLSCYICFSIFTSSLLLILTAERQIFDLLGYQWTPGIFDFITILLCLFGLFAACQHRPNLSLVFVLWLLVWIAWNVFLICLYFEVGSLRLQSSLLSWGTRQQSYWKKILKNCTFPTSPIEIKNENYTDKLVSNEWFCIIKYEYVEILHAALTLLLSFLCLIVQLCLLSSLRVELRKQSDLAKRELNYIHLREPTRPGEFNIETGRFSTGTLLSQLSSATRTSLPWVEVNPSLSQTRSNRRRTRSVSDTEDSEQLPPYSPPTRRRSNSTGRRRKKRPRDLHHSGADNLAYQKDEDFDSLPRSKRKSALPSISSKNSTLERLSGSANNRRSPLNAEMSSLERLPIATAVGSNKRTPLSLQDPNYNTKESLTVSHMPLFPPPPSEFLNNTQNTKHKDSSLDSSSDLNLPPYQNPRQPFSNYDNELNVNASANRNSLLSQGQQKPVFVSTRALATDNDDQHPLYVNFPRGSYRQAVNNSTTQASSTSGHNSVPSSLFV